MAGRGPAPAQSHTRKGNDKSKITIVSDGKTRGPALPSRALTSSTGEPVTWHPMTRRWWNHWRNSPQALRMMTDPDWDYLLDTARIHHEFWTSGRWELAAELRLRAAKFGATPEDRSRLGFEIAAAGGQSEQPTSTTAPLGNVSSIADRRERLSAEA